MNDYTEFLAQKEMHSSSFGIDMSSEAIHPKLFDFQRAITAWAIRKGRAAIFADTGLGKTFMQLEWARLLGQRTLIVAPLGVARQTIAEAQKIGVEVTAIRSQGEVQGQINITNYEMVEHVDPATFGAVILDESSILKSLDGKTRQKLTDMFSATPYRLCCTATPAPNDITEIANHAAFLGIMSRTNMLSSFFVHDDDGWRLKGHAQEPFYRWLASWAMSIKMPSDLGFENDGYRLPPLTVTPSWVEVGYVPQGQVFSLGLHGIQDRIKVRRATTEDRVLRCAELVSGSQEQWIVWHGFNEEGRQLRRLLPDSVLVEGQDKRDDKLRAIEAFQDGHYRILITKPKIAGFGMNFQNANNLAFLGLSDSWEAYYQCIRRSWRFGQTKPVNAYVVLSDAEREVYENVLRKDGEANVMSQRLIEHVRGFEQEELGSGVQSWKYQESEASGKGWRMLLGDSAERLKDLDGDSVGLSVFSPPFLSLYTYSPSERDIGNSKDTQEFFQHFGFIIRELLRVTQPGRNCAVHVSQVPAMLVRDGYIGLKDFRGKTIEAFEDAGWVYHGEVCIDKDPQAQAIRTKSKSLLFIQMRRDASWLRPALADYILVFRKPGDNKEPVLPDITNNQWIEWARPIWYGIRESDTLQYRGARSDDDERHIAPLQLGTIERCIRLWSNRGDVILSPFAGIGSEGHVALKQSRRFVGIELKPEYWQVAVKNLQESEVSLSQGRLFEDNNSPPPDGAAQPHELEA